MSQRRGSTTCPGCQAVYNNAAVIEHCSCGYHLGNYHLGNSLAIMFERQTVKQFDIFERTMAN